VLATRKKWIAMNTKFKKRLSWATAFFAVTILMLTFPVAASADDDPPGRVARIRYLQGSVSFQPAGESDWVSAVTNRPMTTGDQLWADAGSRAEVQLGSATIRVDANRFFVSQPRRPHCADPVDGWDAKSPGAETRAQRSLRSRHA